MIIPPAELAKGHLPYFLMLLDAIILSLALLGLALSAAIERHNQRQRKPAPIEMPAPPVKQRPVTERLKMARVMKVPASKIRAIHRAEQAEMEARHG